MANSPQHQVHQAADAPAQTDAASMALDSLRHALLPYRIDMDELAQALDAYTTELRAQGAPPEAVVVGVKRLLDTSSARLYGDVSEEMLDSGRDNQALRSAIVTIAIAKYYHIDLDPGDVGLAGGPCPSDPPPGA